MQNQDVMNSAAAHRGTATVSRADDALAETMGNLMLWLIPVLAFLAAILR